MAWSNLENKEPKPLGWWYCKILSEFGWWLRNDIHYRAGDFIYTKYLWKMCDKYKINIYGVRID